MLLEEQLGSEAADALENAAGLSQEAKENILAFYEAQGILYDLPALEPPACARMGCVG